MKYCMSEENMYRYVNFAVNVFGVDPNQPAEDVANQGIDALSKFLFETLGLDSTLSAIGIDDSHFTQMASKACGGSTLPGFKPLKTEDIVNIYKMCL